MIRRLTILAAMAVAFLGGCSDLEQTATSVTARVDGQPTANASAKRPIRLDPRRESTIDVTIQNGAKKKITVSRVRLTGQLLGIDFLTYDLRTNIVVDPGATRNVTVPVEFFDLERQSTGYLRARVAILGDNREMLASTPFIVDVRGSWRSTSAVFALAILALTACSIGGNVIGWRRRTLPVSRVRRGVRFATSGLGAGLVITVSFSILRLFPFPTAAWVALLIVPAAVAFGVGYLLTMSPPTEEFDGSEADLEDDELVRSLTNQQHLPKN